MPTTYTETPDNFNEIGTFVEKEINGSYFVSSNDSNGIYRMCR